MKAPHPSPATRPVRHDQSTRAGTSQTAAPLIRFVLFVCVACFPSASAQCSMYSSQSDCEMSPYYSGCSGYCCWWTTSNGCIDLNNDCSMYFYDQTSCNDDSNNGCAWDNSMGYCMTSYCLYESEQSCNSATDADQSACSWDNSKLLCTRSSGTSVPTCRSYSTTECTADKLQGTCIVSSWDNSQGYHDMYSKCQKLDDLCRSMGTDETSCGGAYYMISSYDFMPWCYYDKTTDICVASNCHQKTDETSCNSACKCMCKNNFNKYESIDTRTYFLSLFSSLPFVIFYSFWLILSSKTQK